MKTVQCDKGHFYDAEKYAECPHCLKNMQENSERKSKVPNETDNTTMGQASVLRADMKPQPVEEPDGKKKDRLGKWRQKSKKKASKDSPKTVSFYEDTTGTNIALGDETREEDSVVPAKKKETVSPKSVKEEPVSVDKEINKAAGYKKVSEVTVQFYSGGGSDEEPVVGWLVCVEGDSWGKSFELKTGKNRIGRSSQMDIAILGDNTVSRDTHAVVMFDPKHRDFVMSVNECGGMVYINDELLAAVHKLQRGDIINIGATKLMFVPLCGDDFDWENPVATKSIDQQGQTCRCRICGSYNAMGSQVCSICGSPL